MPTTIPSGLADSAIFNGYVNNAHDTASQALTGLADPGVTVAVYDGATLLGTATADGGGTWSYTLGRLLDGPHSLTATATDADGHVSAASAPLSFKVDTRPPSKPGGLADTSIAQGYVNAAHDTAGQALTGRTDAGATVTVYDGATQLGTAKADGAGAWSFTLGQLADGAHKLTATAADAAGNVSATSDVLAFTVDTAAPAAPAGLADVQILGGYVNAAHDLANQALTGKAQAYAMVSVYDGTTRLGAVQASGTGDWSYTLGKLADGDHSLTATAADKAGNTGPASGPLAFTVDTQRPPASLDHVTAQPSSTPLLLSGVSEAGATLVISEGGTKLGSAVADANGDWSVALPALSNQPHSFTICATDLAGNKATSISTLYNATAAMQDGPPARLTGVGDPSDTIVNLPAALPAGVSYDAATHSFTLDPSAAAYQNLGPGETTTVTVDYGVTHGTTTTAAEVSWTVTGLTIIFGDGDVALNGDAVAAGETLDYMSLGNALVGDVRSLSDQAQGGNDIVSLRLESSTTAIGDALSIADHAHGGDDQVTAVSGSGIATALGDAVTMGGDAVGGNDTVTAVGLTLSVAIGDANSLTDHAHGGDDLVAPAPRGHSGDTWGYGDALTMSGYSVGGADTVSGHIAYGDAQSLTDYAQGGDDVVLGAFDLSYQNDNRIYGDGALMSGHAQGGNDTLTGHTAYGDAQSLTDDAQGGDDLVQGSTDLLPPYTANKLYGDGEVLADHAHGGDDTLVAGAGNNIMWGDAATIAPTATTGADLFVFHSTSGGGGHDQIMDFEPGKDRIELDGFGFAGFADLSSHLQTTPDGVLITLDANNDVLVRGVTVAQLTAGDFVLG